jgi:hypothetical protein
MKGEKLDDISPQLLLECAALVKVRHQGHRTMRAPTHADALRYVCYAMKANSIEGCKLKEVEVVYTRWRNLKKTKSMEVGQVGFQDASKVRNR